MADENEQAMNTREMVQLRKLQATMYERQTKLFLRRLNKKPELKETSPGVFEIVEGTALTFDELREAILAFMHRPDTVESFNMAVSHTEQNKVFSLDIVRNARIVMPLHPQLSPSFVAAFQVYAAVDAKVLYGQILKDLLAYQSYLLEMAHTEDGDVRGSRNRQRRFGHV
jgi:hypothetical protein